MIEALVLSVGALTSFVISGVERNHRQRRPHSPMLTHAGYALCGGLGATSVALAGVAVGSALGWM